MTDFSSFNRRSSLFIRIYRQSIIPQGREGLYEHLPNSVNLLCHPFINLDQFLLLNDERFILILHRLEILSRLLLFEEVEIDESGEDSTESNRGRGSKIFRGEIVYSGALKKLVSVDSTEAEVSRYSRQSIVEIYDSLQSFLEH